MYDIYDNDFDKAFDEAVDAIEKKEHRLIYADKLKAHYSWWKGGSREMTMDEAKSDFDTIIDLQPTVEAELVKHGRWITDYVEVGSHTGGVATTVTYCSVCDEQFDWRTPYCPNCGAKMQSTMGQVKVDVSIKKPTKRWDTCGLTEDSVLVDTGSRGEKVEKVGE